MSLPAVSPELQKAGGISEMPSKNVSPGLPSPPPNSTDTMNADQSKEPFQLICKIYDWFVRARDCCKQLFVSFFLFFKGIFSGWHENSLPEVTLETKKSCANDVLQKAQANGRWYPCLKKLSDIALWDDGKENVLPFFQNFLEQLPKELINNLQQFLCLKEQKIEEEIFSESLFEGLESVDSACYLAFQDYLTQFGENKVKTARSYIIMKQQYRLEAILLFAQASRHPIGEPEEIKRLSFEDWIRKCFLDVLRKLDSDDQNLLKQNFQEKLNVPSANSAGESVFISHLRRDLQNLDGIVQQEKVEMPQSEDFSQMLLTPDEQQIIQRIIADIKSQKKVGREEPKRGMMPSIFGSFFGSEQKDDPLGQLYQIFSQNSEGEWRSISKTLTNILNLLESEIYSDICKELFSRLHLEAQEDVTPKIFVKTYILPNNKNIFLSILAERIGVHF